MEEFLVQFTPVILDLAFYSTDFPRSSQVKDGAWPCTLGSTEQSLYTAYTKKRIRFVFLNEDYVKP